MKFAIFGGNGLYWGVIEADSEAEAIEAAAREWGTEGYTDGIGAVEIEHDQEAALDEWVAAGQPADELPLTERQEKLLALSMGDA